MVQIFLTFFLWQENDSFVLCRVFHKGGLGRRIGEQVVYLSEENIEISSEDLMKIDQFGPPYSTHLFDKEKGLID